MTDIAHLIRNQNLPVIWVLRFANHSDLDLTTTDIFRMLVLKAFQMNPSSLTGHGDPGKATLYPITLSHLRGAASLDDWLKILERALKGETKRLRRREPKIA
jgi:hypothetical protein